MCGFREKLPSYFVWVLAELILIYWYFGFHFPEPFINCKWVLESETQTISIFSSCTKCSKIVLLLRYKNKIFHNSVFLVPSLTNFCLFLYQWNNQYNNKFFRHCQYGWQNWPKNGILGSKTHFEHPYIYQSWSYPFETDFNQHIAS